jgi:hypothetical protein
MDMVAHQAITVEPGCKLFDDLRSELVEQISIRRPKENVVPMVAAQRDMVERRGHMQAKRPWHRLSRLSCCPA